ncbi:hypothetical protein COOONC_00212 [Cooperia oncophora]
MSRSRSASRSSRSSSDSDHSSASSNSQDRRVAGNSRSRSTSRERSVDKGSGRSYRSPLAPPVPDIRIPRKDEFRSAKDEVPAPPAVPQKTLRVRVSISEVSNWLKQSLETLCRHDSVSTPSQQECL